MLTARRTPLVVGAALSVLGILPACSGSDAGGAPETLARTEQIPVTVSITVKGDLEGTVDKQTVKTQLVMRQSEDPQAPNQIFGIETVEPIPAGPHSISAGVAIQPYKGPGKYTIAAGSIYDSAQQGDAAAKAGRSSVKVLWRPKADVEEIFDYYRREKPCRVKVDKQGAKGKLECPALTDEGRVKHFSLTMSWEFAEPSPATSSTTTPATPSTTTTS